MSNTGHRIEIVDPYDSVDDTDDGGAEAGKSPHELPTRKKNKKKPQDRNPGAIKREKKRV